MPIIEFVAINREMAFDRRSRIGRVQSEFEKA